MSENIKGMLDRFMASLPKRGDKALDEEILADLLLVNCIDCRYPHVIHDYMSTVYKGKVYDHLVLPGASLAGSEKFCKRDYWAHTFLETAGLSLDLHKIRGVLILDHRTCGAYRECKLLTKPQENTSVEYDVHKTVANDTGEFVLDIFRKHGKPGSVHVYLTPEVHPGGTDFPEPPKLIFDKQV